MYKKKQKEIDLVHSFLLRVTNIKKSLDFQGFFHIHPGKIPEKWILSGLILFLARFYSKSLPLVLPHADTGARKFSM